MNENELDDGTECGASLPDTIEPGDKLQCDGKATVWLVRGVADNGIALATAAFFGKVSYTLIDMAHGVRGAMNVIGGGLGIDTTRGDDPNITEAIAMLNNGSGISHRNRVPLNITKHQPHNDQAADARP